MKSTYLVRFGLLARRRPFEVEWWTLDCGINLESLTRIEGEEPEEDEPEEEDPDSLTAGLNFWKRGTLKFRMPVTRRAKGFSPKNASPVQRTDGVSRLGHSALTGQRHVGDDPDGPNVGGGTRRERRLFPRRAKDYGSRELEAAGRKDFAFQPIETLRCRPVSSPSRRRATPS